MANRQIENLPLEWVRVFEAAGRLGSFTAAGTEIGLTQAAVSQRIRNLEDRLGTMLFNRLPRGVTLTVEGEAWLPYVTNALAALNRSVEDLFGKPLKRLIISAPASVMQMWIAPRLVQLSKKANFHISLATMNIEGDYSRSKSIVEIRYGSGDWPDRRQARLYGESLVPMAAPSALQGTRAWQDLPFIAVSGPRPGWQEWSEQTGEPDSSLPTLRFDSFVSAFAAAVAGAGVILGSVPLCRQALASGTLVVLAEKRLENDTGYWMTSKESEVPRKQWDDLVSHLCAKPS